MGKFHASVDMLPQLLVDDASQRGDGSKAGAVYLFGLFAGRLDGNTADLVLHLPHPRVVPDPLVVYHLEATADEGRERVLRVVFLDALCHDRNAVWQLFHKLDLVDDTHHILAGNVQFINLFVSTYQHKPKRQRSQCAQRF